MKGEALSHGAVTIVNAIANGMGAAFGIDLFTKARVRLTSDPGVRVVMEDEREDTRLVELCVRKVLDMYGQEMGAEVSTESNIPISRGLKSSSAAANAVVMATLRALSMEIDPLDAVRLGTRSAIEAGVSVTGAFDDAAASMLGGVVLTDNRNEIIIKRDRMPKDLRVLLHVPEFKIRKGGLPLESIRSMTGPVQMAFEMALKGEYFWSMTLNGICHSLALGLDQRLALEALRHGALAAGLSGTGPATAILAGREKVDELLESLEEWELMVVDMYNGEEGR